MNNITLNEVLKSLKLVLNTQEIYLFCDNTKVCEEFIKKVNRESSSIEDIITFLRGHSEEIKVDRLLMVLAQNYKKKIEENNNRIIVLRQKLLFKVDSTVNTELNRVIEQNTELKNYLNLAVNFLKRAEQTITFFMLYDSTEKRSKVKVMDPREFIAPKKHSKQIESKKRKFDEVDLDFKDGNEKQELGLEFLFQFMILTDLYEVFPTTKFGDNIRTMIGDNAIIKSGLKTREELREIKKSTSTDKYDEILEQVKFEEISTDIKHTLREYVYYLDMDKLLLISAFRVQNALEDGEVRELQSVNFIKSILTKILKNIEEKEIQISCDLLIKRNGKYESKSVKYSVKDLEEVLNRFTKKGFVTIEELQHYQEKLNNGEVTLEQLELEHGQISFLGDKIEELSLISPENFIYVSKKFAWNTQRIIEELSKLKPCSANILQALIQENKLGGQEVIQLYQTDIIDIQIIQCLKGVIDLSNCISFETVVMNYMDARSNVEDEDILKQYQKNVDLYKEIHINDKSEEELEEKASVAMTIVIENFEEKEYEEAVKEHYRNGLITLDSIAEWSNEDLIIKLYNQQLISLEELEGLTQKGKASARHIMKIYEDAIWDKNLSQEQRVAMLCKGWISIETIEKIFRKNLLDKEDLRRLVKDKIISEEKKDEIIESLSLEEAEANATITLAIDDNIEKIHGSERVDGHTKHSYPSTSTKSKIIISPNAREEFFELLGAKKVKTTKIDEDNPFYNYQFYVIPGEDGKIHLNSPVIAERYFEDKHTERNFATENATYFFQYGDLMVLSKYAKKDEVVGKKENVIFRSTHTIANPKRKGNWASSVILNIIKTMLAPHLKEFTPEQQRDIILAKFQDMYTMTRIQEILGLGEEIDSGKHLYEVVKENIAPNFEDSDEEIR